MKYLLEKAIKGYRDKVTLATKFGIVRDPSEPQKTWIQWTTSICKKILRGQV
jgi:aryl-alcohol dehydrogenase-like predicted oxidoreductase